MLWRSWWSNQGGRQAGTRQIGTKIHINYKFQWVRWRKHAQCWEVRLSLIPWAFHLGKNGGAVCLWMKGLSSTVFQVLFWVCRTQQREALMTGMSFMEIIMPLTEEIDFTRKSSARADWSGWGMFCPYLPDHWMAEHHGRTWTQFKGSGAFQIQVRSPGDYSISGNYLWFPPCLPSSFLRKLLNREHSFFNSIALIGIWNSVFGRWVFAARPRL